MLKAVSSRTIVPPWKIFDTLVPPWRIFDTVQPYPMVRLKNFHMVRSRTFSPPLEKFVSTCMLSVIQIYTVVLRTKEAGALL